MHDAIWILWLAMVFDRFLPDPPNRFHPVAWMGSGITQFRRLAPESGRFVPFVIGMFLLVGGGAMVMIIGIGLHQLIGTLAVPASWLVGAYLLSLCFSAEGLFRAGWNVERPLVEGNLPVARQQLSYHLVSRATSDLNASQVSAATIESLSENACDSIVAPLFYFVVGGLPLALLYRFVNTCDAMLGYRDPRHEWLGKASARTDDLLNLLPARLTVACILASGLRDGHFWRAVQIWRSDRYLTASPNAGQSMSALAGLLGLELEKVGAYRIGLGQCPPQAADISRATRKLRRATWLALLLLTSLLVVLQQVRAIYVE